MADIKGMACGLAAIQIGGLARVAVFVGGCCEQFVEVAAQLGQAYAILRALGAGETGDNCVEIEFDDLGVINVAGLGHAEHALRFVVGLDGGHQLGFAAGGAEVIDGFFIDREVTHGRAILRRHIGDGATIGGGQGGGACAIELDELADDFGLAHQLGDGERQVSGGDAFTQLAGHVAAHHIGREESIRLTQHARFGFNAAHAPRHDADTVDHGGVRVGTEHGVGVPQTVFFPHAARQMLHVDLVNDAVAGRHHTHGFERALRPLHEQITLGVALEFDFLVALHGIGMVIHIDLNRVIHHHIHRHQRFNIARRHTQARRRIAHGGKIIQRAETDQILQHDAHDDKWNLCGARAIGLPRGERFNVFFGDLFAVALAHQRFEYHADGERQAGDFAEACGFEGGQ